MSDIVELITGLYTTIIQALTSRVQHSATPRSPLFFYNTLSKSVEQFTPPPKGPVRMYNCGPTVYGRQHIGNLSMFVFTDILRKTLEYNGMSVKQVINFTDFGHLSSDADEGDDKMTKGLKRDGLAPTLENMRVLGEKYANLFLEDIRSLNVAVDNITFPRASDYIPAQIAMIHTLEEKGYTYTAKGGVYYDTSRFPAYGKLGDIQIDTLKPGARVKTTLEKKHPTDFLLWKSSKKLGWDSPWGKGFPGWHIECSAMIRSTLGAQIDIHTGGIEHIPIHHNNEIAQSEAATGQKPFSRFWLHRAHLQLEGAKIAKSDGNVVYLSDVTDRGIHPLSLRYLLLGAHYRSPSNFTWDALSASQTAYAKLVAFVLSHSKNSSVPDKAWKSIFVEKINTDLDTPQALSVVWDMIHDKSLPEDVKVATLLDFDTVLGLNLSEPDSNARALAEKFMTKEVIAKDQLPEHIAALVSEREIARAEKNWKRSDELRDVLAGEGYAIEDSATESKVSKL